MRAHRLALVVLFFIPAWVGSADARAEDPPSSERAELVREFLEATEVDSGVEGMLQAYEAQIDSAYPQVYEQMLADLGETAAGNPERYETSRRRFIESFRQLFRERVNFAMLSRLLYAPIYGRYFSDDELRELIAFYRTPTGRKSLEALPRIMAEVVNEAGVKLAPVISDLVHEAEAREKTALGATPH